MLRSLLDLVRLRKQQWLSLEQLEAVQRRKLRVMLKHAYENVEYYRNLFDSAGISPEDIRTRQDLGLIPITSRRTLQELPLDEITARNVDPKKCKRITTAGSSGSPLTVLLSYRDSAFYDMVWARTSLENGKRIWDVTAYLKFHFPPRYWFEHLGIWRKKIISLEEELAKQVELLKQAKADIIRGNAFQLVDLARTITLEGVQGIHPRLVFSMGSLLDGHSRKLIESAFRAEVFDFYGMTELGCIGWECSEHMGYHVNTDTVVVELIADGRPVRNGERGSIVCTGLHSYAMPFIRYDTGDVGVAAEEKCPCGRSLPLLESLDGRADDFFVSKHGDTYSPSVIVNRVKLIRGIREFRLTQEHERLVVAELVPDREFSQQTGEHVVRIMQDIMGKAVLVEVQVVEAIPPDPSGKIRCLISKLR